MSRTGRPMLFNRVDEATSRKQLDSIMLLLESQTVHIQAIADHLLVDEKRAKSIINRMLQIGAMEKREFISHGKKRLRLYGKPSEESFVDDPLKISDSIKELNLVGQRDWLQTAFFGNGMAKA